VAAKRAIMSSIIGEDYNRDDKADQKWVEGV
jgi:hypothetical protein